MYSFGIPIGSALGILFGGYIASKIDWRFAFFAVGIAGILVAPIFKLTVAEPPRGQYDVKGPDAPAPTLMQIVQLLSHKPSFWIISLGAAASSMMGYGLFFWLPSFFVRSFDLSLLDASVFYGAILLIGGIALHQGRIAEMKTGEGKTLVAPLAAALNAMSGGRLIPLPGGVLIHNRSGDIIGAVGVAGAVSEEDEACAMAGIAAAGFGTSGD